MVNNNAEMKCIGYGMVGGKADPLLSNQAILGAAGKAMEHPGMKAEKQYKLVLSMFPAKKPQSSKRIACFETLFSAPMWIGCIVVIVVEVGHYSSTKEILM